MSNGTRSAGGVLEIRIPDMPPADTPLSGTELIQIVQLGRSRKLFLNQLTQFNDTAWLYKNTSYVMDVGEKVAADSTGSSFTISLPAAPVQGDTVELADAGAGWGLTNIMLGRNGSTIMGLAEDMTLNISRLSLVVTYDGTTWRVDE